MKKRELFAILNTLDQMNNVKGSVKFAYAVAKNRQKIQPEVEMLRELVKAPPEIEEFERKRLALCHDMSEKDEEGKPLVKGTSFVMADQVAFNSAFEALRDEYKAPLEEFNKKKTEFENLLDESVDLNFHKIAVDSFPDDISPAQMEALMSFVAD